MKHRPELGLFNLELRFRQLVQKRIASIVRFLLPERTWHHEEEEEFWTLFHLWLVDTTTFWSMYTEYPLLERHTFWKWLHSTARKTQTARSLGKTSADMRRLIVEMEDRESRSHRPFR